jgi:hypothetical protein
LLGTAGVCDEDIISNYALSQEAIEQVLERAKSDPLRAERIASSPTFIYEAHPEIMEAVLTYLNTEYNGVRSYLRIHGADEALFQRLEDILLG